MQSVTSSTMAPPCYLGPRAICFAASDTRFGALTLPAGRFHFRRIGQIPVFHNEPGRFRVGVVMMPVFAPA